MKNRISRTILSTLLLLLGAGSVLAQESTSTETGIGFGPMIAILGMGILAILFIGLVMSSRDSSDESETN
jgi:hypothetical protein